MVNLTSEQRRRLDKLAEEIAHDNPRLARALAGGWYAMRLRRNTRKRRRIRAGHAPGWCAMLLILAAAPLLSVGAILAQPVLMLLGAIAVVNGLPLFIAARLRRPPAT